MQIGNTGNGSALSSRACLLLSGFVLLLLLQGCYYLQAAHGHFGIMSKSRPLDKVIDDPTTDAVLSERLQLLRAARSFATERLLLPDNGSYQSYADLGREYVLWNVFAAPEFSLQPRTWCYLVVGCLAYRGYFDRNDAQRKADKLRQDGFDVYIGGVPAYSTLGRFNDPLLNTMLQQDDADLVALLFHELAHQRLYLKDDTAFNESFASAVAEFGLQQWSADRGENQFTRQWRERQTLVEARLETIRKTREHLEALYVKALPPAEMRREKQLLFNNLNAALAGDAPARPDRDPAPLNNAWLATLSLYRGYLPAFRKLFTDCAANWSCFYDAVDALGRLSAEARAQSLAVLAAS